MRHRYFITGTDTDVGKTYTCIMLLKQFNAMGYSTLGIKPLSSGGHTFKKSIRNFDALALQKHSSLKIPYDQVNPFCFLKPVAPLMIKHIKVKDISDKIQNVLNYQADFTIIEGIGGLCMPLNREETIADLIKYCDLEIILVVGMKLGCLNHAILTINVIKNMKLKVKGWIANCIDPKMCMTIENIKFLDQYLNTECLGIVGYNQSTEINI